MPFGVGFSERNVEGSVGVRVQEPFVESEVRGGHMARQKLLHHQQRGETSTQSPQNKKV